MIVYIADDHYGVHPGLCSYEEIKAEYPTMKFAENDWSLFTSVNLAQECDLLILNLIADTCQLPIPDREAADAVKRYCMTGKPLLLLHGGSSALWPYEWFRRIVGLRWVRGNDPDGVQASFHPVEPYTVNVAKTRHQLTGKLQSMELPCDEIYTGLEQTAPFWTLMETTISSGTFPQCTESATPWGGRVINYLPGHNPEVTRHPAYLANLKVLINDLLR